MDRYLRYNQNYEPKGSEKPILNLNNYLVNKNGEIVGLRFEDSKINSSIKVYIDIPIERLILSFSKLSDCEIEEIIQQKADNQTIEAICLFDGYETCIKYRKVDNKEVSVGDGLKPIFEEADVFSIYYPRCVIRYKDRDFAMRAYDLVTIASDILSSDKTLSKWFVYDIAYLRFSEDFKSINIYIKTQNIKNAIDNPNSFGFLTNRNASYIINKEDSEIIINVKGFKNFVPPKPLNISSIILVKSTYEGNELLYGINYEKFCIEEVPILDKDEFIKTMHLVNVNNEESRKILRQTGEQIPGNTYSFQPLGRGDLLNLKCFVDKKAYISQERAIDALCLINTFLKSTEMEELHKCAEFSDYNYDISLVDNDYIATFEVKYELNLKAMSTKTLIDETENEIVERFIKHFNDLGIKNEASFNIFSCVFHFSISIVL